MGAQPSLFVLGFLPFVPPACLHLEFDSAMLDCTDAQGICGPPAWQGPVFVAFHLCLIPYLVFLQFVDHSIWSPEVAPFPSVYGVLPMLLLVGRRLGKLEMWVGNVLALGLFPFLALLSYSACLHSLLGIVV